MELESGRSREKGTAGQKYVLPRGYLSVTMEGNKNFTTTYTKGKISHKTRPN